MGLKSQIIEFEAEKLLNKGVIIRTEHDVGDFISPIFLKDKKDGSHCEKTKQKNCLLPL